MSVADYLINQSGIDYVRRGGPAVLESLTDEQRADLDARILAGEILEAIQRIKTGCGVSLREAMDLNRVRYQQLRAERGTEFACGDEEYWSGYSECPFDAISRDL